MSDFLNYWDTRIDANERFFNNYPHIANFAFSECQKLWDRMEEKNKALLTRVARLEEALQKIADGRGMIPDNSTIYMSGKVPEVPKHFNMYDMREIARRALEEK